MLLCEANVAPSEVPAFTAGRPDGPNDRAHLLFDFLLNPKVWLSLARCEAEPLVEALKTAVPLPGMGQWATFLRNHDELDLSRLTDEQRRDVFAAFAPEEDMRLYGRGIRRRLAPMLGGDRRRSELAYPLQLSPPGTPVVRYGEEIGMGEDLSLPGRDAIRTPMQWDDTPAGASPPPPLSSSCGRWRWRGRTAPPRSTCGRSCATRVSASCAPPKCFLPAAASGVR